LKYRVSASIYFNRREDADIIFEEVKRRKELFTAVRRGEPGEQRSFVMLERCYHDEEEPRPCEVIEKVESG